MVADEDDAADGTLSVGPSTVGGFVRYEPDPARTPAGPSLAPAIARVFAFADERFGTGIGPLVPAPPAR